MVEAGLGVIYLMRSASLDQCSNDIQETVSGRADRAGPIVHYALADVEYLCSVSNVFAADDYCRCLAHGSQMRMKPADKADGTRPLLRKSKAHHLETAALAILSPVGNELMP